MVLGREIRSSLMEDTAHALNVLSGYAVYCHLTVITDAQVVQKALNLPVIALSERSGVYLQDQELEAIGFESVWILEENVLLEIKPGEKHTLKTDK